MNSNLLRLLDLTLRAREYIKKGVRGPSFRMKSSRYPYEFQTMNHHDWFVVEDGNLDQWFQYLTKEGVDDVKFCANMDNVGYNNTQKADWGIIGSGQQLENITYIWRFDANVPSRRYWYYEETVHDKKYNCFEEDKYDEFLATLKSIKEIAHKLKLYAFEEDFKFSLDILSGIGDPEIGLRRAMFRFPKNYGEEANRKLGAIAYLSIYGGSGNWDDNPEAKRYEETEKLFLYGMSVLANVINYGGE